MVKEQRARLSELSKGRNEILSEFKVRKDVGIDCISISNHLKIVITGENTDS